MALTAHTHYSQLKTWCASHLPGASSLDAKLFRVAGPRHTSAQAIVSGIGGFLANGRWCRRRITPLVYMSVAPETAKHESNEHARRNNLPLWQNMPKVTVAIDVKAPAVLDLTNAAIVKNMPVSLAALMAEDWRNENKHGRESLGQALGRAAFAAGFDCLRVPSKPDPAGVNVVVFRRIRGGGARLTLLNPQVLKTLGRK